MDKKQKKPVSEEAKLLKRFEKKLKIEALMKSILIGFVCGFALCIPVSVISFIAEYNTIWICVGVLVAGTVGFGIAAYMKYYKTSLKKTASRVDGVGLEERMITMLEYSERDDALAKRQRADAREALEKVEPKHVKIPFPKTAVIAVAVAAVVAVSMMVTSTVKAVRAEEAANRPVAEEPEKPVETEEDKIIREMIEEIRREIDGSKVRPELKETLHGMVDDLEASLRPQDSTAVKIAKISETAQEIHRILQNELSRLKIAAELKKHETTHAIGVAIESGDMTKIEAAFTEMYDSIAPLVGEQKYDLLIQTAEDIFKSLEDSGFREPKKEKSGMLASAAVVETDNDALADALEKLAEAMLAAVPPPEEEEGDEDKISDEINKDIQDAIQDALGAIKDALDDQKEAEGTDKEISDTIQDALDKLGFGNSSSDSDDEKDPDEDDKKDDSEVGPANPDENGEIVYDSVIDGKTPYMDVYDEYYKKVLELLTSGDLTEEERTVIENYFNILN